MILLSAWEDYVVVYLLVQEWWRTSGIDLTPVRVASWAGQAQSSSVTSTRTASRTLRVNGCCFEALHCEIVCYIITTRTNWTTKIIIFLCYYEVNYAYFTKASSYVMQRNLATQLNGCWRPITSVWPSKNQHEVSDINTLSVSLSDSMGKALGS